MTTVETAVPDQAPVIVGGGVGVELPPHPVSRQAKQTSKTSSAFINRPF